MKTVKLKPYKPSREELQTQLQLLRDQRIVVRKRLNQIDQDIDRVETEIAIQTHWTGQ